MFLPPEACRRRLRLLRLSLHLLQVHAHLLYLRFCVQGSGRGRDGLADVKEEEKAIKGTIYDFVDR